jgi:hypothetical protein
MCYTFMLPLMFEPRFQEECFYEPPFLGGVLEGSPRVCAVTASASNHWIRRGIETVLTHSPGG